MAAKRDLIRQHPTRAAAGAVVGLGAVVVISAALIPARDDVARTVPALVLVVAVLLAAYVGGRVAAVVAALAAAAAFNLAFIPPYWTLEIDLLEDALALLVFLAVGLVVGTLVAREHEGRQAAEDEATELAALNDRYERLAADRERLANETTRLAVLERVDEQRSALLRSVSHDLRTPLAAIRAVASDLRSDAPYDEATRAELLDLVIDESERLDRIVGNLLSLSRIEAGNFHPDRQAVAVDELANECARRLRRLLGKVRLQIELPPLLPLVDADYTQLDQVLTNLLENAVRHSPPSSTVRIGAVDRRDDVEIWVLDEGPGVFGFERERVFEPFRRGEGSTSSGVGLAICRAIVEAHGGSITVDSGRSGGARFAFTVPKRRD